MLSALAPHAHKIKYLLNENSTVILTGVGVAGTAATAVLTGHASFKAAKIIAEEEKKHQERLVSGEVHTVALSKTEKTKYTWHLFLPPAAVGVTTIAAIIVAHRIDAKKIAALAIATGVSERALQEYKDKVVEKFTDRQATAVRDEIAQDRVTANPVESAQVFITGTGDVLFFDQLTGRYFKSTIEKVRKAENEVNYQIIHFMECSLTRFFEDIGLDPTTYTDTVGWNINNKCEVEFSTVMSTDGQPCIAIDFKSHPRVDYDNANTWGASY